MSRVLAVFGAAVFARATHARVEMFRALWNTRVGDEIWVSTPDGRGLRYLVSETQPRVPGPTRVIRASSSWPSPADGGLRIARKSTRRATARRA